jgi:hypothetical protein
VENAFVTAVDPSGQRLMSGNTDVAITAKDRAFVLWDPDYTGQGGAMCQRLGRLADPAPHAQMGRWSCLIQGRLPGLRVSQAKERFTPPQFAASMHAPRAPGRSVAPRRA